MTNKEHLKNSFIAKLRETDPNTAYRIERFNNNFTMNTFLQIEISTELAQLIALEKIKKLTAQQLEDGIETMASLADSLHHELLLEAEKAPSVDAVINGRAWHKVGQMLLAHIA